jgi:hypothetical protein
MCKCADNCKCFFEAHVRGRVVIRVDPGARYNPNVGMQDQVLSWEGLIRIRIQRRPWTKGLVFHKYLSRKARRTPEFYLAIGKLYGTNSLDV